MNNTVLIIGGYGNFGRFISTELAKTSGIKLVIAGRNVTKAQALIQQLKTSPQTSAQLEACELNIYHNLAERLATLKPTVVIHTSGPFQNQTYHVAEACIQVGAHYIDLADARQFVAGIADLDKAAKAKNVLVCAGASSVPALTSAIIDNYLPVFDQLESVDYAIATAQLTNQGLATTAAVLSYAGKPFSQLKAGKPHTVFGWLDTRKRKFWQLGARLLGNCDIPDLALFPQRYPSIKNIRFQASLEVKLLHRCLAIFSGAVKLKVLPNIQSWAKTLLSISRLFDFLGHDNSGFYMELSGTSNAQPKTVLFEISAKHGDGLYIPCIPSILLTQKLLSGATTDRGAKACMGLITLNEYLHALEPLKIDWRETL
ncbi:saccharopine dehydrogenase NADP-binding domain-containing protein [Saccharophagus degradans]|uniref:Saccharopine dehydrogenase NADP-binding domain-containing protein n=1 Tax=Saccharophagus degradans TaxID=86304 RepID=A0AAW7X3M9_9GAMM|nr:saccharopine dehydrogenase NADP-binding domain-containing protein [Saccharophagus degradans]MBU2987336.1 saccharopine dehydrogenase NADP-binding domain-containing protein [Saccharophagus degradans]MDO6421910.1 saccharopine dehydrogenase NADP-binding domain-containing protein [Saccharophagus degradans]MDO6606397.1 saccharopine dehydrogenase NADP-binding domain-containing protein [Saccharophagus degradans]WGO97133.1 saccharopine dehydrogenase NADP-binding domain-containing protein [Saccharopha